MFNFKKKNDYLNLRLKKREREIIIKFGEIILQTIYNDIVFVDNKINMDKRILNNIENEFIRLLESRNNKIGSLYYITESNSDFIYLMNDVIEILSKRLIKLGLIEPFIFIPKLSSERDILSRLFVETIVYLKVIENFKK